MKKLILVIFSLVFLSSNANSNEWFNQMKFNKWLLENGHSQYLKNGGEPVDYCATLKKILNAEGLLATCIQHEMDHLEGILFIDYLSKLKKSMIIKKLSKFL